MKKFYAPLLALLIFAAVSGCDKKTDNNSGSDSTPPSNPIRKPDTLKSAGTTTITPPSVTNQTIGIDGGTSGGSTGVCFDVGFVSPPSTSGAQTDEQTLKIGDKIISSKDGNFQSYKANVEAKMALNATPGKKYDRVTNTGNVINGKNKDGFHIAEYIDSKENKIVVIVRESGVINQSK